MLIRDHRYLADHAFAVDDQVQLDIMLLNWSYISFWEVVLPSWPLLMLMLMTFPMAFLTTFFSTFDVDDGYLWRSSGIAIKCLLFFCCYYNFLLWLPLECQWHRNWVWPPGLQWQACRCLSSRRGCSAELKLSCFCYLFVYHSVASVALLELKVLCYEVKPPQGLPTWSQAPRFLLLNLDSPTTLREPDMEMGLSVLSWNSRIQSQITQSK